MKSRTKKVAEIRDLEDRSWDLLAEIWAEKEADEIFKQIEIDKAADNTAEMDAFFAEHDAKNLQRIKKYTSRNDAKHFMKNIARVAQVAAVCIAVLALAGGVAIAASSTIRIYLTKLCVEVTPEYTSLTMIKDTDSYVDVPAEWQGEYYPSIIPEGLVIGQMDSDETDSSVTYVFPGTKLWQFAFEEMKDGGANIDTEDAVITPVKVCGFDGTMVSKREIVSIYWFNGNKLFFLDVRGHTEEEVLRYANSIQKIK